MYNLSDIVRYKKDYGLKYKGSIAYQYLTEQGPPYYGAAAYNSSKIDFECLKSIVEKTCTQSADDDTFVIHVRAFDVIELSPNPDCFIKIIKKYSLHIRFRNCLLFYGNHNKGLSDARIKKSINYLEVLKNKIEELNLTCELVSKSADEDFISLATAKCYIAGYRGFGWLAASINPNEVIWDIQDPPVFPWLFDQNSKDDLIEGYEFYKKNKK
tara:strand:- start:319 stop:957 length:639 start_codon:yes stop_codon:yes gene_type:complete